MGDTYVVLHGPRSSATCWLSGKPNTHQSMASRMLSVDKAMSAKECRLQREASYPQSAICKSVWFDPPSTVW